MRHLEVIIPCSTLVPHSVDDRIKSLNFAIKEFYSKQIGVEVTLIVVEQILKGKKPHIIPNLEFEGYGSVKLRPIIISYPVFNKPWMLNVGEKYVQNNVFLVAETDMFCQDSYFGRLLEWFDDLKAGWAFAWKNLCYTGEAEKELLMKRMPLNGVQRWTKPVRGYSEGGLVLWTKQLWAGIGGANEFFTMLGGIDNEIIWRASKRSGTYHMFPQKVYHLYHPGVKKSSRPERTRNIQLLRITRQKPGKVNEFLKKHGTGDESAPLCGRTEWGV